MIHWSLHTPCCWGQPSCGRGEAVLSRAERARFEAFRVPSRRADFLLGRLAAKHVVADALAERHPGSWPLAALEILSDPSGAPFAQIAPEAGEFPPFAPGERLPLSVSISHYAGHALCAATWSRGAWPPGATWRVGIDLGVVEPRSNEFVRIFFTEDEQRYVLGSAAYERDLRANLVWCAKEAVLKALGLGLTVDTFELTCLPDAASACTAAWLLAPADPGWKPFAARCGPGLAGGATVHGIWRAFPGFVGALALKTTVPAASARPSAGETGDGIEGRGPPSHRTEARLAAS